MASLGSNRCCGVDMVSQGCITPTVAVQFGVKGPESRRKGAVVLPGFRGVASPQRKWLCLNGCRTLGINSLTTSLFVSLSIKFKLELRLEDDYLFSGGEPVVFHGCGSKPPLL